jgi:hypothetical protein
MIINKSSKIKRIHLKNSLELKSWSEKNNVILTTFPSFKLVGYNKIIYDVTVEETDTWYVKDERFFVIERFDKVKNLLSAKNIEYLIIATPQFTVGEIVNTELHTYESSDSFKGYAEKDVIINDKISAKSYIPSKNGIINYINESNSLEWKLASNDIKVAQTNMNKKQFDSLVAKLRMVGAPTMLVDINTVATINNQEMVLYTRQNRIECICKF